VHAYTSSFPDSLFLIAKASNQLNIKLLKFYILLIEELGAQYRSIAGLQIIFLNSGKALFFFPKSMAATTVKGASISYCYQFWF
jgi:hypothetical protein